MKNQSEYNVKRDEVLSKFREEFAREYYTYDPVFRSIAEMLIRDGSPYEIIERLIIDRKKLMDQMIELAQYSTRSVMYPAPLAGRIK